MWNVHVGDLLPGDQIIFSPSTFDFEWLNSSARRFEIFYDPDNGERIGLAQRPYLFSEFAVVEEIWEVLTNHLSKSQIYVLRDLIEDRRSTWQLTEQDLKPGGVFWQFCRDALKILNGSRHR